MSGEDKLVKKPFLKNKYTQKQILELKGCSDPISGPLFFMENFLYVQHATKGRQKFKPYPYQKELIKCYNENRYAIALVSRQMGKTTVAAGYLLWYAMFKPDSTILVASKTGADSKEIMLKVRYAYEELPDYIRAGVKEYNKHSIIFDNNSRIVSTTTTENTGRGMALSLVYLDEFAFVNPPKIAEDLWTSLSPTLSTGGRCLITSTPASESDTFAKIWFDANNRKDEFGEIRELGVNGFKPFFADWTENPDRDQKWADEEKAKIGEDRFAREHLCKFIVYEETLINSARLSKLESQPPLRVEGHVRWYKEINPNNTYVVALDPSMGTGGDYAAIEVYELPSFVQVAEWQHNKTIIEGQMRILKQILKDISDKGVSDLYWSVESNSLGEAALVVVRDSGEESFPGSMLHDPRRDLSVNKRRMGFVTTNRSKLEACSRFKSLLEGGKMTIHSESLMGEIKNFIAKGNSYEARSGSTDDLISATLLFIRMAEYISTWDDACNKTLTTNINGEEDDEDEGYPMPVFLT